MDIKNFNPYIRFCSLIKLNADYPKALKAYDFRLFHVVEGGFTAVFDDREITVSKGDTLIFPPDTAYRLLVSEYGFSNHIIINFDFTTDSYGESSHAPSNLDDFNGEEVFTRHSISPFDGIFYQKNTQFCLSTLKEMCFENHTKNLNAQEMLSALLKKILIELMRKERYEKSSVNTNLKIKCKQIKEYINKNLTKGINNITVAREFGYHPYYINALFKKNEGVTIHAYIISQWLELSKELLLSTDLPIAKISEQCGFSNASYFSEFFIKNEGVSPSEYREKAR